MPRKLGCFHIEPRAQISLQELTQLSYLAIKKKFGRVI